MESRLASAGFGSAGLELPLTFECRIVYQRDLNIALLPPKMCENNYPRNADGSATGANSDLHTEYYGQIVGAYILRWRPRGGGKGDRSDGNAIAAVSHAPRRDASQPGVPESYAGAVMGDISASRGHVTGMDADERGATVVTAVAPYTELTEYSTRLRSISRGTGDFTMERASYEQVPHDVQERLVKAYEEARAQGR